ncbi:MAG: tetratricopeptide repeat protein, partial [Solirubrobacteraceae bacterium]
MNRHERRAAAKRSKINLSDPTANTPAALHEAGLRHLQAGRPLDAQLCCQQALAANPEHADSLHLMGLLSLQARQYDHATEWLRRAIAQAPKPEYLVSLGVTLQQQGRRDEALKVFDQAAQLDSDDAGMWRRLGDVYLELGRPEDALRSYRQVLKLSP